MSMIRKRILYLFPDRSSAQARRWEHEEFWPTYRRAAAEAGMDFAVADPEHVLIAGDTAYWRDEPLDPARDIVVYDARTEPVHEPALWWGLSLTRCLQALGFWLAIPLDQAVLTNDKFATARELADSPVPVIPSVRVNTGRDVDRLGHQNLVPDSWFPVFVKPVSWGRGLGCVRCPDRATLDAVLGLASGSAASMLVQPSVGTVVADLRVVAVEGEIVAMYDRIPGSDSHVANVSRGARVQERDTVEQSVHDLVALVHRRFDLAYVCVDLLRTDSGQLWFSELEADGAVTGLFGDPEAIKRVVGGRFRAYAARHDRHYRQGAVR
ncbi:RimK family alpha-L-glutamate ligase [Micromonospora sp. NPDC048871]|uniref:ATP-grasp domain-containing protein n=1 Tax=unclassified Micromonospora TaxID=2617518 RepID=UPI002E0E46FF|nr:hypothetical protein OIE53_07625 [Micromonospora sp. NBC_01739]